jgi:hypothetical protein
MLAVVTRARGGRRFRRALRQTDLHRPAAGRRRHFFLADLLFADSAAADGIGADADVGLVRAAAAGRTIVRSPAAPSTFLFGKIVVGRFGADAGARAIGVDVGFAWSGRRRWCGADPAQRATGSSTTTTKFCSTDSGAARHEEEHLAEGRVCLRPDRCKNQGA